MVRSALRLPCVCPAFALRMHAGWIEEARVLGRKPGEPVRGARTIWMAVVVREGDEKGARLCRIDVLGEFVMVRGIGCGLMQMFLLAAVMNGLGPERWG